MKPHAITRPGKAAMRTLDFVKRNYHWFLAALAGILVLVWYMPAVYLSAMDSDNIQIPMLFHDVVELGHPARDWIWGGHSDIFPDIALVFLLEFILRNRLLSLQIASGIFLAAYVGVLTLLYKRNGGRNAGTFAAAALLFFVLLLRNFGLRGGGREFISISTFVVPMHTSISILSLACFALFQRAALEGGVRSLAGLAALCFITTLSNDLFLIIFTAPVIATLIVARFFYPGRIRRAACLAASITGACAAGHFLAKRLSPFQIDAGAYT
ncbi:MAG TPA: hypothetical protein VG733_03515, partial [Chthoniobacteraceae bacterium]|nr:hypothetical protein [Chthoniobacteraceae bacterium]